MPGLDGLRAIAVLGVIAYHLGIGWAPGGLLGVGVFFTLSGYLITDILLSQLAGRGHVKLGSFWLGRARRLLPALFVMLIVVTAWVTLFGPSQPPQFREAVAAAALYVNNWQQIFQDVSYFALFEAPSPLNHLWSLSVEEQFYIVWPLVLVIAVAIVKEAHAPSGIRPKLAGITLGLAAVSALAMALIYKPSLDPSRVYYGTDTRAGELLVGAALAMVWPSRELRANVSASAGRWLDAAGAVGLVVIALMMWRTSEFSSFLYEGGFFLLAIATALVVAALAHPACGLGRIVGFGPLRWIGVRSYGIYLWTFPIIVLTTPEGEHGSTDLLRNVLQVAAIFIVAALSWRFIEEPIRHGAIGRAWGRMKHNRERGRSLLSRPAWIVASAAALTLAVAAAGLAGVNTTDESETPTLLDGADVVVEGPTRGSILADSAEPPEEAEGCTSVIHIGDSTSEGLVSPNYLPDKKQRIDAQYARVGAENQQFEISGAMSIVEHFEGHPNAEEVAQGFVDQGYEGCWVLALGTNDTANVVVGPNTGRPERIDRMMAVIGDQPVLWVNVKSLRETGPYANEYMELWDEALLEACARYPNMRVFDWASQVKDVWFIEDGIHFTSPGYAARSRTIANGLAAAFPESGTPPAECLVE